MKTKLTLTLDKELISKARVYAENSNSSISKLVSDYFIAIFNQPKLKSDIKTPVLNEISGILSKKNYDKKKIEKMYRKHLEEKYL